MNPEQALRLTGQLRARRQHPPPAARVAGEKQLPRRARKRALCPARGRAAGAGISASTVSRSSRCCNAAWRAGIGPEPIAADRRSRRRSWSRASCRARPGGRRISPIAPGLQRLAELLRRLHEARLPGPSPESRAGLRPLCHAHWQPRERRTGRPGRHAAAPAANAEAGSNAACVTTIRFRRTS